MALLGFESISFLLRRLDCSFVGATILVIASFIWRIQLRDLKWPLFNNGKRLSVTGARWKKYFLGLPRSRHIAFNMC